MISIHKCSADDFPIQDNLFQTSFWGAFKTMQSQQACYFLVSYTPQNNPRSIQFPLTIFLRTANNMTYAYAPKAPSIQIADGERGIFLEQLSLALKDNLPDNCICIRFDIPWECTLDSASMRSDLRNIRMNFGTQTGKLRKAPLDYLCPDTVILNLTYTPEQLLSHMRQTTRNSIRRAYKSNVSFERYSAEESLAGTYPRLKSLYAVYKETAIRKNIYYDTYDYFHDLFSFSERLSHQFKKDSLGSFNAPEDEAQKQSYVSRPAPQLVPPTTAIVPPPSFYVLTATKDGVLLSGLILAICGHTAYYMYSGSSTEGRELMPNYGLQWESILFARRSGCTKYDMLGISPTDDKAHPMYGLYLFKTGFGGETKHYEGTWDYVYNEDDYTFFKTQEQLSARMSCS